LWSLVNGTWLYNEYIYTANTTGVATMSNPATFQDLVHPHAAQQLVFSVPAAAAAAGHI